MVRRDDASPAPGWALGSHWPQLGWIAVLGPRWGCGRRRAAPTRATGPTGTGLATRTTRATRTTAGTHRTARPERSRAGPHRTMSRTTGPHRPHRRTVLELACFGTPIPVVAATAVAPEEEAAEEDDRDDEHRPHHDPHPSQNLVQPVRSLGARRRLNVGRRRWGWWKSVDRSGRSVRNILWCFCHIADHASSAHVSPRYWM